MKYLTRKDEDVGEGVFDSIKWAFSEHVHKKDNKRYKSAILHGNEDAPDKIEFFTSASPRYDAKPAYIWIPRESNPSLSSTGQWIKAKAVRIRKVGGRLVADILTTGKRALSNPTEKRQFYGKRNAQEFAKGLRRQGIEAKVSRAGGSLGASPYYIVTWYSS